MDKSIDSEMLPPVPGPVGGTGSPENNYTLETLGDSLSHIEVHFAQRQNVAELTQVFCIW